MGKAIHTLKHKAAPRFISRQKCLAVALIAVTSICGSADALEIPTGSEDLVVHWDNTLRYTLASRVKGRNPAITNSINNDDGDRNFGRGIVSSRLDLLTEADAVYKNDFGIRLSAAAWYDPMYRRGFDNDSVATENHIVNDRQSLGISPFARDRYGLDAELLDAFTFAKFDLGEVPVNTRVGRHTIYWGEAFFPYAGMNGISYGQSPIDLAKALSMPGVELKEIFRPLNQVSVQVQPTNDLSIAAQYYLQWEPSLFPESGTYLGMYDPFLEGGESVILNMNPLINPRNGGPNEPRQMGDWGIAARYSPEGLKGTIGAYYRRFSDKLPQVVGDYDGVSPIPLRYHFAYGSNIDLYGLSFAKQFFGISVGSEVSYRHNMPIASTTLAPVGARGDTMHAVLNFLSVLPKTPLFHTGTAILEFTYGRMVRVTKNPEFYNGRAEYGGLDKPTRDNTTVTLNFVPEWKQVFPSVDLAMPINVATGISGNSAVTGGGAKKSGSYSVGLSFDILAKYKIDLTYASFFGTLHPDANGQIPFPGLASVAGDGAGDIYGVLKDRDLLSLTFKTSF